MTTAIEAPSGKAKGTGPLDPAILDAAAKEEVEREALAKFLTPAAESMRLQNGSAHTAAAATPGSRGMYLFWFVIAFSAAAIVASFAIK